MKYCPNCGAPIEEGHKFCANCGAKLTAPEMPPEPVYTDDAALLNNPALQPAPAPEAPVQSGEKIPELTLEPDLWGLPPAAKPAEAPTAAQSAAAATAAAAAQAPSYASVMEGVEYDNDYRREQEERRKREEARRLWEEEQRRREAAAQASRPDNVPNDYTMSQPAQEDETVPQLPDETLMLIWSIILTCMCSIPGIVGLVKTVKARKAFSLAQKTKLLSSAKIWLIVGTVLYLLPLLSNLF